ncbi:glycosyltransferase family 2 protein [Tundrisphaera lichenicola]|uniref:glycosyltransferase family 2 protein n=1 Tax=Tundrisphaera lichenicola TaxID=2029860 RepID=UPI003EBDFDC5
MRFALIIPALNEEEAIVGTLRRALAAREKVVAETVVTEMSVVFVNDGSTDRTQAIVDQPEFSEVIKVRFAQNQGYGAAIKAGWRATDADLLGFIDSDGTCDPDYSVPLIRCLTRTGADVVLAGRMSPESKMPRIRRFGNVLFAKLLGAVSGKPLTDCASGFRVVRRSSLPLISPLPKGMHFTPAMSAICLLDPRLRIEEVPMPYEERIGRSKLSVLKDGLRFLYVILFTVCCYTPLRTMLLVAGAFVGLVGLLVFLLSALGLSTANPSLALGGAIVAMLAVWTGVVCHQLNFLLIGPRQFIGPTERLLQTLTEYKLLILSGLGILATGLLGLAILPATRLADSPGALMAMVFLMSLGATSTLVGVIVRVVWAVGEKLKALVNREYQWSPADPPSLGSTATLEVAFSPALSHPTFEPNISR